MISELGNFFLAMAFGFACVQFLASFWGIERHGWLRRCAPHKDENWRHCEGLKEPKQFREDKYLTLGRVAAFLQGGFLIASFVTLIVAFLKCDFSLLLVTLHDHTQLPWYYRLAATWGNHEGSLLLFVLILSGIGCLQAILLREEGFRARTLTIQGLLTALFLFFLIVSSNPFKVLPFLLPEGKSLNPLLQDRGLLIHPPLLYLGYVGFSAPFSFAIAALWGEEEVARWGSVVRPWVLFAWGALTGGITLGSWWAYYELGWGGWWFWDPVENASFLPWLAGTALLHTLLTGKLYRWSLFLCLLTFGLSLLGTFLVRSSLIISVHSFIQDPERGIFLLSLLGGIMGVAFFLWTWKAPNLQSPPLLLFTRQGALLLNSLFLCLGLATVILGTLYPFWSDFIGGQKVSIGAPYFERTFIPLMIPLLVLLPIGGVLRQEKESLFRLLITPLTVTLGSLLLLLYVFYPISLWAFAGIGAAMWILGGTGVAFFQKRLSFGPALAHFGVGLSLLGVSVGGGFRVDETRILSPTESLEIGGVKLTLQEVQYGKGSTYLYEKAVLSYTGGLLMPEKRLYQPQNSMLSETAIHTNGLRDLYILLGPYQGENRWLIRASSIPLAPWIWIGGAFMVLGAAASLFKSQRHRETRKEPQRSTKTKKTGLLRSLRSLALTMSMINIFFPTFSFAETDLEKRANVFYQEVRCPICLGQSIAESETKESKVLKTFILDQMRRGEAEETIRKKLRSLYGDEIIFRPPFETHTLFLWLTPFGLFFFLLVGLLWKMYPFILMRRREK